MRWWDSVVELKIDLGYYVSFHSTVTISFILLLMDQIFQFDLLSENFIQSSSSPQPILQSHHFSSNFKSQPWNHGCQGWCRTFWWLSMLSGDVTNRKFEVRGLVLTPVGTNFIKFWQPRDNSENRNDSHDCAWKGLGTSVAIWCYIDIMLYLKGFKQTRAQSAKLVIVFGSEDNESRTSHDFPLLSIAVL